MIFELPDIFFGSHPKKEMASQPLQVRQYGFAKNSKKPYHKRIFKKSGDIFFGATSQQVAPKKILGLKTQKPQRFLGFFMPIFKVEFKRYHFPKSTFGEDLN